MLVVSRMVVRGDRPQPPSPHIVIDMQFSSSVIATTARSALETLQLHGDSSWELGIGNLQFGII